MIMIMRILILSILIVGSTSANLVVFPISYTASENLRIDLDEDEAHISGEFEFDIPDRLLRASAVRIPVWLPAHTQPDQTNLKTLLETVSFQGMEQIALNKQSRAVLDQTIGLSAEANGQLLDYDRLYTYEYGALLRDGYSPVKYWRPGVNEARFLAKVDRKRIDEGKLRIDVKYRQPLIKSEGRTLLFYVPLFDNTGFPGHEKRPHNYIISVQCPDGFKLVAKSKLNYHETPKSTRLVISPEDQQVILVELIKAGQAEVTTPLDPAWLKESQLVEMKGESACTCEHKNDINLKAIYMTGDYPLVTINRENYKLGDKVFSFEIMVINPINVVFKCPEGKVVVRELVYLNAF